MTQRDLLGLAACAALAGACGGECGGESLSPGLHVQFDEVQACTALYASPPSVKYVTGMPCPTSGRPCCFKSEGYYWLDGKQVGTAGQYDPECETVELVNEPQCLDLHFKHEAIHYLLDAYGKPTNHGRPEFACQ